VVSSASVVVVAFSAAVVVVSFLVLSEPPLEPQAVRRRAPAKRADADRRMIGVGDVMGGESAPPGWCPI